MLLLASVSQAWAGSYVLHGRIVEVIDADKNHVTLDTPVTLELGWSYEPLVPAEGETTVTFRSTSPYFNPMKLTIGSMVITDTPKYGNSYPKGHFTDANLDSFTMAYWDIPINGDVTNKMSCYAFGDARRGETFIRVELINENSTTGDQFVAEIPFNLPEPPAGLFGDGDDDADVDAADLAGFAFAYNASEGDVAYVNGYDSDGNGVIDSIDLGAIAANFGQIL